MNKFGGRKRPTATISTKAVIRHKGKPPREKQKATTVEFDGTDHLLPEEGPCAHTSVTNAITMARSYQSVHVSVSVQLPCDPRRVEEGLDYAQAYVDTFLAKAGVEAQETLELLAEQAEGE